MRIPTPWRNEAHRNATGKVTGNVIEERSGESRGESHDQGERPGESLARRLRYVSGSAHTAHTTTTAKIPWKNARTP